MSFLNINSLVTISSSSFKTPFYSLLSSSFLLEKISDYGSELGLSNCEWENQGPQVGMCLRELNKTAAGSLGDKAPPDQGEEAVLPPKAGLMVKSWSSTLRRGWGFPFRILVTSRFFLYRWLQRQARYFSIGPQGIEWDYLGRLLLVRRQVRHLFSIRHQTEGHTSPTPSPLRPSQADRPENQNLPEPS